MGGFIPIFVVRRTEGSPFFGSFPFGGSGFPFNFFGDSEDRIDIQDTVTDDIIPEIPLMTSFFDEHLPSKDDEEKVELCGFICSILKQFDEKLKDIESSIKNIKGDQGQQDINNSTYTEKVLEDGTIVKVNRTIISDTSDDGNSYFFHSTSFHNFDKPEEMESKDETVDEATEKPEEKFEEFPIKEYEEIPFLDESLNEVPEDNAEIQRSKRSDPFEQQQLVFHHPNQLRRNDEIRPSWKPLHDDTRVNDLITQNGKRGSLIRIEPESEFIRRNPETGDVEPLSSRYSNPWAQETIY